MFELAYLLRIPVYQLVAMPYDEYLKWHVYFEARPVGWREDDRVMKLLSAQGVKAKPESVFASLAKLQKAHQDAVSAAEGRISAEALKRSAFFSNMLSAQGGDKLEFLS